MSSKLVYSFNEGSTEIKKLLGGKGANLAEMTRIGLPVPEGFTITTEACINYYKDGRVITETLKEQILEYLNKLENASGKKLGDKTNPLLVSVRSGAVVSMPGMMDTILNLGLNDETVKALKDNTQNGRFAMDCYRRFIQMFSSVVMNIEHHEFESILDEVKYKKGVKFDTELAEEDLAEAIKLYKRLVIRETGRQFPEDPKEQLFLAIKAVFDSWENDRAIFYRKIHNIPHDLGTAVNIQSMVFGNMGDTSGTGVAFTRNPSTGENKLYGEFLINAQGEDVVAGIRTPQPITSLKDVMPEVFEPFVGVCNLLEKHYRDLQDIEFTIERGKLFMLQTRTGKRTATAAVRTAVEMVKEGLISKEEALLRVDPAQIEKLLHRRLDPDAKIVSIAQGLPASPGAASGKVVFSADEADALASNGEKVILVRTETTPDDIHGIVASQGILTSRGGMTSHAAVVARGMGKPCVCGCEALKIDMAGETFTAGDVKISKGDLISIDGSTGQVIVGEVPMIDPELSDSFKELLSWADEIKTMNVRANADNPEDAMIARDFGAEGIGLCRTEHMFMSQDRLPTVQEMIMAESLAERKAALAKLLPFQQEDFEGILAAMDGFPVTIRLLDPPLHEFLPNMEELVVEITKLEMAGNTSKILEEKKEILRKVRSLHEFNPMLGHRGCRLAIVYPEMYEMQARAIFQATAVLMKKGYTLVPEIMIPLVGHATELKILRELVVNTANAIMAEQGVKFDYLVGTMIELPRACVTADEIAEHADFFSFGTNDLTQTTFGFSRDDAEGKFLSYYVDKKILENNPFAVLDQKGVGALVQTAVALGRGKKEKLKVGICGEHGGEPTSIEFLFKQGLNYVSCSPYRVPVARLATAQATLKNK
jgi:pyruvate,orthophosphate dikinase